MADTWKQQTLTDLDLPPIARTQANYWEARYWEAYKELVKANKGLRRLRKKLGRMAAKKGGQRMRIIKVEKCADCPYCLLGADDIQFTCDEANIEDPTWYINRPIPDWCPLPEEEV